MNYWNLEALREKVALPFGKKYWKKMILIGFEKLAQKYQTYDLKLIEQGWQKDYKNKIIVLPFGDYRRYFNPYLKKDLDWGYHLGVDYFLPPQTPLYSILEGRILRAGNFMSSPLGQDWGNLVVIHTPEKLTIYYAHLKIKPSLLAKVAQKGKVKKGELLGWVAFPYTQENGNWPAHLHLQIIKGWVDVGPGYAANQKELQNYLNPQFLFPVKED